MKLVAIIIETRKNVDIDLVLSKHEPYLPSETEIYHIDEGVNSLFDYNKLLTSASFWQSIEADRVLVFQHDSGLLKKGIEEFYEWDYIGAPWRFSPYMGNGGLSLRNPSVMLDICLKNTWNGENEDIFFAKNMSKYNPAPVSIAEKFSVETIYKLGSIGYHAIDKWLNPDQCKNILNQYK